MKSHCFMLILLVSFGVPSCGTTQQVQIESKLNYDIQEAIDQVDIDKLQNIYVLTEDDRILRYNAELNKKFEYNNRQIGDIVSIDATNPQKILCFIKDFNRILVLDNTLAEINIIDLSLSEYLDVTAIGRSNDNQIWVFDPINQVLVKLNTLIETQLSSNRLSDYNLGEVQPTVIKEESNRVIMIDESIGLLIFDNFGKFIKLIPETGISHIQILGEYIFFTQGGKYYQYHMIRYEKKELDLGMTNFENFIINEEYYYFFGREGLKRIKH